MKKNLQFLLLLFFITSNFFGQGPLYQDGNTFNGTFVSGVRTDYYRIVKDVSVTSLEFTNVDVSVYTTAYLEKRDGSYDGALLETTTITGSPFTLNLDYSGNYFYRLRFYTNTGGITYTFGLTGFNACNPPMQTYSLSGTNNSIDLSGISTTATNQVIVISDSATPAALPDVLTAPVSAGTTYSGSGSQIVHAGASVSSLTVTGLSGSTKYYVRVYGYEQCGNFNIYSGANEQNINTCVVRPTSPTSLALSISGASAIDVGAIAGVTFGHAEENGYIVKASSTNSFADLADTASLPSGFSLFNSDDQVVYAGTSSTPNRTIYGFAEGITYYFKVYPYSLCNGTYYFGTGYVSSIEACSIPSVDAIVSMGTSGGNFTQYGMDKIVLRDGNLAEGDIVYMNTENSFTIPSSVTSLPSTGTTYTGSGQQVLYAQTASTNYLVQPRGLSPNTTYYFRTVAFNLCNGTYYIQPTGKDVSGTTLNFSSNLVSTPVFGAVTSSSIGLNSFSAVNPAAPATAPTGYIVKINTTNSFTPYAQDVALPTANTIYAGSGEQVVYAGTSITPNIDITGLSANTEYYFSIYAYFESQGRRVYQQTGYEFSKSNNTSLIAPTITFDDISKSASGPNFDLNATSDSAGTLSYRIVDNGGTDIALSGANNKTVTLGNKLGTVIIEVSQASDVLYSSASKTMTLTITKPIADIGHTIFYASDAGTTTLDLATKVTSASSGARTYEIVGDALGNSIVGNTLTVSNTPGSYIIKVTQEGDATYAAHTRYLIATCFGPGFTATTNAVNLFDFSIGQGEDFEIEEAIYYTNPVVYAIEGANPTGSSINGRIFTAGNAPGTVTLRASVPEDTGFYHAYTKDVTVSVRGTQTITFDALAAQTYGDATFDLTATASSGLDVTYASSDPSVATVSGNTVTIVGAGNTNITASQAGSAVYSAAPDVVQNLTVNAKPITVTADPLSRIYGEADPTFTYQITTGSLEGSDVLSGSLSRASGEDVGTYAITQGDVANANYAITFVSDDLTITQRDITVTADDASKGETGTDPLFTHQVTAGSLAFSDMFTGSLTREVGETQGTYAIQQGTLALNANYNLTFVEGQFTINAQVPATALHFDGASLSTYDYISVPDNNDLDMTTSFTFEAWVNFDQTNVRTAGLGWRAIFNKSRYIDSYGLMVYAPTGLVRFYHAGMGIGRTDYSWASLTPGTWYHIAVTLTATEAKIYIDGVEVASSTFAASSLSQNNEPLLIGSSRVVAGDPYPFDGTMEEVRLWNTARTATEINDYKDYELNGDESGLVLNYNFNQGSLDEDNSAITSVIDNSTNGYNGTLTQFTLTGTVSNFVGGTGSIVAAKSNQAITFNPLSNVKEDDADFDLTAISDSGLTVTYASSDSSVATVSGNTVTIVGIGTTTITASQVGNPQYNAALEVVQDLTVEDVTLTNDIIQIGKGLKLYPNPVKDQLSLIVPNELNIEKINIINVSGKQVASYYVGTQKTFDVSDLSAGVYVVQIVSGKGIISRKLIKE